ncbi:hypothetical protein Trydic_g11857 [Trypoxylus dichotomus]
MEPAILFMFSNEATFRISSRVNKHNYVIGIQTPAETSRVHAGFPPGERLVYRELIRNDWKLKNKPLRNRITLSYSARSWNRTRVFSPIRRPCPLQSDGSGLPEQQVR